MNPNIYIKSWLTPAGGLRNAERMVAEMKLLPIGDFFLNKEVRRRWILAQNLVDYFTKKSAEAKALEADGYELDG